MTKQSGILYTGKKVFTAVLATITIVSVLNAGDKYSDLTVEYLNNSTTKVKRVIASDPQTNHKILEILSHDKDLTVRANAVANPNF